MNLTKKIVTVIAILCLICSSILAGVVIQASKGINVGAGRFFEVSIDPSNVSLVVGQVQSFSVNCSLPSEGLNYSWSYYTPVNVSVSVDGVQAWWSGSGTFAAGGSFSFSFLTACAGLRLSVHVVDNDSSSSLYGGCGDASTSVFDPYSAPSVYLDAFPIGVIVESDGSGWYRYTTNGQSKYSSTNASKVFQFAVGNLTTGGLVSVRNGTYYFENTVTIANNDTRIEGSGLATILSPTKNVPVFTVSPTWRTEICGLSFKDYNNSLTSVGFIYINNDAGGMHFLKFHDLYFQSGYRGIYTDTVGSNLLGYCVFENLHFESPKSTVLFLSSSIDERVKSVTVSVNVAVDQPLFYKTNPSITSCGAFWRDITVLRIDGTKTMNGMIYLNYTNEFTLDNAIFDSQTNTTATGYLLELHQSSRNTFNNLLVWSSHTDGIRIGKGCTLNQFDRIILNSNLIYGINDLTELTEGNSFTNLQCENQGVADLNLTSYDLYSYTFDVGKGVSSYSYMVYTDGTNYFMRNGSTGRVNYSSTNASKVFTFAFGNLSATGGTIDVKPGEYGLDSPLVWVGGTSTPPSKTLRLIGSGRWSTILKATANINILEVSNGASVDLEHFYLNMDGKNGHAIYGSNAGTTGTTDRSFQKSIINDIEIRGVQNGYWGMYLQNAYITNTWDNIYIRTSGGGIYMDCNSTGYGNNHFGNIMVSMLGSNDVGVKLLKNAVAMSLNSWDRLHIDGGDSASATFNTGLELDGSNYNSFDYLEIENVQFAVKMGETQPTHGNVIQSGYILVNEANACVFNLTVNAEQNVIQNVFCCSGEAGAILVYDNNTDADKPNSYRDLNGYSTDFAAVGSYLVREDDDACLFYGQMLWRKAQNTIISSNFQINGTGTRTLTITHALCLSPVTYFVTIAETTDVRDYDAHVVEVYDVGITTLMVRVNVTQASATNPSYAHLVVWASVNGC